MFDSITLGFARLYVIDYTVFYCYVTDQTELSIDKVEVRVDSAIYETGKINWTLCNDETCFPIKCKYSQ